MGEEGFKNIIIGAIATTLFAFLILSFIYTMGGYYGADTTTFEQNSFNFSALNNTLGEVRNNSEDWRAIFEDQNIFSIVAGIVVTGIFKIGLGMFGFIVNVIDIVLFQPLEQVLGVPKIVTGVLIGLVIISAIFGLWRTLKQGN